MPTAPPPTWLQGCRSYGQGDGQLQEEDTGALLGKMQVHFPSQKLPGAVKVRGSGSGVGFLLFGLLMLTRLLESTFHGSNHASANLGLVDNWFSSWKGTLIPS